MPLLALLLLSSPLSLHILIFFAVLALWFSNDWQKFSLTRFLHQDVKPPKKQEINFKELSCELNQENVPNLRLWLILRTGREEESTTIYFTGQKCGQNRVTRAASFRQRHMALLPEAKQANLKKIPQSLNHNSRFFPFYMNPERHYVL